MIRIGICEDERQQRQVLEEMVCRIADKLHLNREVKCFQSGEELLAEIDLSGSMDIVLLDIEMEGAGGVETAKSIREADNRAILIFVSFHDQYCKELMGVQPFDFIDKPVEEERLEPVLRRAVKVLGDKEEIFEYSYQKALYRIPVRKICYFYSDKRKVVLVCEEKEYSFYAKLDEVEQQLSENFVRIHQRYLVNPNQVVQIGTDSVTVGTGAATRTLPVSRALKEEALKRLARAMLA